MVLAASRFVLPPFALMPILSTAGRADPITLQFAATIGSGTSIDTDGVFGKGTGANLSAQVMAGSIAIDAANLRQVFPERPFAGS